MPSEIVDLPQRVLSTPLGAMIRPMLQSAQDSMLAATGAADPFSAAARGGENPLAAAVSTGAASASAHADAVTHAVTHDAEHLTLGASLDAHGSHMPIRSTHVAATAPFIGLIQKASAEAGAAGLSDVEQALLAALGQALTAGAHAGEEQESTMDWAAAAKLLARIHCSPDWPAKTRVATAFLLRGVACTAAGARELLQGDGRRAWQTLLTHDVRPGGANKLLLGPAIAACLNIAASSTAGEACASVEQLHLLMEAAMGVFTVPELQAMCTADVRSHAAGLAVNAARLCSPDTAGEAATQLLAGLPSALGALHDPAQAGTARHLLTALAQVLLHGGLGVIELAAALDVPAAVTGLQVAASGWPAEQKKDVMGLIHAVLAAAEAAS